MHLILHVVLHVVLQIALHWTFHITLHRFIVYPHFHILLHWLMWLLHCCMQQFMLLCDIACALLCGYGVVWQAVKKTDSDVAIMADAILGLATD